MAADRFLDTEGLRHLWEKIKAWIPFLSRKTQSIPFGQVDSTSTATVFTATVDGIDELRDGVCCYLRNGVVTSASGFTININGLGAKPVYNTMASATALTTHFNINYTMLFIYNSTRVSGGCWDMYVGYDTNTTYDLNTNYTTIGHVNVGAYPLHYYSLCAFDINDKLTPFVTTATTSTGKALVPSVFPIGAKIYSSNYTQAANTSLNDAQYLLTTAANQDLRYSSVNHNVAIFPNSTFNRVFMPVIVDVANNTFTLTTQTTNGYTNNFTNERSLKADNFYIEIGFNGKYDYSYYCTLIQNNPIYYYDGTRLIEYSIYKSSIIDVPEYTIEKLAQAETSYSASYVLKKDNVQVGATINIPKDMVVSNGEVKTVTVADEPYQGAQVGDKYIDLTIANTSQNHIYIPVKDLVDVYIAGNGIQISNNNYISVKVNQNQSNGLGVGYDGISMYVVTPSINGVGGTNGSMLATDKEKLDDIEAGADVNMIETVKVSGTALQVADKAVNIVTETAYDPTTNKIATMSDVESATPNVGHLKTNNTAAQTPSASESFTGDINLHKVAKTGSYNDLNDKPSFPSPADASPLMDGTATVGTSTDYAREDHVHPTDTSRVPTTRTVNGKSLSSNITLDSNDIGAIPNGGSVFCSGFTSKYSLFLPQINNYLYSASQRFIVTHKAYDSSTDTYLRDLKYDLFNGSYEEYRNRLSSGEKAKLYIGSVEEQSLSSSSANMWTYGSGYIWLHFYSTWGPTEAESITVKKYVGSSGWSDISANRILKYNYGTRVFYISLGTTEHLKALEITYTNTSGSTWALSEVQLQSTRPFFSEMPALTKYPISQRMFGSLTAPKFIKSDGTSSQFLKADGSVDSNTYATTSQLPSLPLSIANGGTGATTKKAAEYAINGGMSEASGEPADSYQFVFSRTADQSATNGVFLYRTAATIWSWIKNKIASVLGIGGSNGVPTAPTAAAGTNTTQIATTAFVQSATNGMAIDTNVVHKTGNETIAGVKTFTNNVKTQDADIIFETKNGDKHTVGISLDSQPFEQAEYTAGALRFSDISLNGIPVLLKNILNPIETQDAATKGYVDSEIENIKGEKVRVQCWTGQYGMAPYSLVAFAKTSEGMVLTSFTTTGGTGQKTPVTTYKFPIGSKIYFYDSEDSAATAGTLWEIYTQFRKIDARYSAITGENVSLGASTSLSAYYYTTAVFLRVSIDGEYWKPYYKDDSTTEIIVSLDQLVSGNYYIYLGRTTAEIDDDNHRYFQLEDNNPLYYYDGTNLVDWATKQGESAAIILDNYLKAGDTIGQISLTEFNPINDTVHVIHQTLGSSQKEQARTNIGAQETLVSGTNLRTVNGQNLLGSGNIDTVNGYINADTVQELPTASSAYQAKIGLVPSITTEGSIDYYACEYSGNSWSWVKIGTTSPIVSVQAVDATSELVAKTYSGKCFVGGPSGSGALIDLSASVVYEYNVEGLDKVYVSGRSWGTSSASTIRYFVGYYNENGYISGLEDNLYYPFNNTPCILTNEEITLPQGTKYIRLNISSSYTSSAKCVGVFIIGQSIIKSQVTPNTFIYGTVKIDQSMPSDANSNTEIIKTSVDSAFGIMFPSSYSNIGRPTQVIAMLHGSNGCVTPSYFGYDDSYTNWPVWRQKYLDAGFAVMDINGYGVSSSNDRYSQPNGNPQSAETLDKAFEFIKLKYNVCDKLLLHGTSMGGANAMAYLLVHPNKVAGVALFAPEVVQHVVKLGGLSDSFKNSVAQAWGYNDAVAAIADGFGKLVGYSPFMEDDFNWVTMDSTEFSALTSKTRLADVQIRIWHGDADANIPIISSQKLVDCLRKANTAVTLRTCVGGAHNISGGAAEYVCNEAISWFKRFVNY